MNIITVLLALIVTNLTPIPSFSMEIGCNNKTFLCYDKVQFYPCIRVGEDKTVIGRQLRYCSEGFECDDDADFECQGRAFLKFDNLNSKNSTISDSGGRITEILNVDSKAINMTSSDHQSTSNGRIDEPLRETEAATLRFNLSEVFTHDTTVTEAVTRPLLNYANVTDINKNFENGTLVAIQEYETATTALFQINSSNYEVNGNNFSKFNKTYVTENHSASTEDHRTVTAEVSGSNTNEYGMTTKGYSVIEYFLEPNATDAIEYSEMIEQNFSDLQNESKDSSENVHIVTMTSDVKLETSTGNGTVPITNQSVPQTTINTDILNYDNQSGGEDKVSSNSGLDERNFDILEGVARNETQTDDSMIPFAPTSPLETTSTINNNSRNNFTVINDNHRPESYSSMALIDDLLKENTTSINSKEEREDREDLNMLLALEDKGLDTIFTASEESSIASANGDGSISSNEGILTFSSAIAETTLNSAENSTTSHVAITTLNEIVGVDSAEIPARITTLNNENEDSNALIEIGTISIIPNNSFDLPIIITTDSSATRANEETPTSLGEVATTVKHVIEDTTRSDTMTDVFDTITKDLVEDSATIKINNHVNDLNATTGANMVSESVTIETTTVFDVFTSEIGEDVVSQSLGTKSSESKDESVKAHTVLVISSGSEFEITAATGVTNIPKKQETSTPLIDNLEKREHSVVDDIVTDSTGFTEDESYNLNIISNTLKVSVTTTNVIVTVTEGSSTSKPTNTVPTTINIPITATLKASITATGYSNGDNIDTAITERPAVQQDANVTDDESTEITNEANSISTTEDTSNVSNNGEAYISSHVILETIERATEDDRINEITIDTSATVPYEDSGPTTSSILINETDTDLVVVEDISEKGKVIFDSTIESSTVSDEEFHTFLDKVKNVVEYSVQSTASGSPDLVTSEDHTEVFSTVSVKYNEINEKNMVEREIEGSSTFFTESGINIDKIITSSPTSIFDGITDEDSTEVLVTINLFNNEAKTNIVPMAANKSFEISSESVSYPTNGGDSSEESSTLSSTVTRTIENSIEDTSIANTFDVLDNQLFTETVATTDMLIHTINDSNIIKGEKNLDETHNDETLVSEHMETVRSSIEDNTELLTTIGGIPNEEIATDLIESNTSIDITIEDITKKSPSEALSVTLDGSPGSDVTDTNSSKHSDLEETDNVSTISANNMESMYSSVFADIQKVSNEDAAVTLTKNPTSTITYTTVIADIESYAQDDAITTNNSDDTTAKNKVTSTNDAPEERITPETSTEENLARTEIAVIDGMAAYMQMLGYSSKTSTEAAVTPVVPANTQRITDDVPKTTVSGAYEINKINDVEMGAQTTEKSSDLNKLHLNFLDGEVSQVLISPDMSTIEKTVLDSKLTLPNRNEGNETNHESLKYTSTASPISSTKNSIYLTKLNQTKNNLGDIQDTQKPDVSLTSSAKLENGYTTESALHQNSQILNASGSDFTCETSGRFPDPKNCSIYHECLHLSTKYLHVARTCLSGTLYDRNMQTCTTKPVPCPEGCTSSNELVDPNDCNRYYKCFWASLHKTFFLWQFKCPPSMGYDAERNECVDATLLPNCGASSEISANGEESSFDCVDGGRFPMEYSCDSYYECKEKKGTFQIKVKTCSKGKLFDRELEVCRKSELVFCPYEYGNVVDSGSVESKEED